MRSSCASLVGLALLAPVSSVLVSFFPKWAASSAVSAGRQRRVVGGRGCWLDQLNAHLPLGLIGRGEVDVALAADGQAANTVRVDIR